jgi:hypothetical protein
MRRHSVDILSLVSGLLFLTVAGMYAVGSGDLLRRSGSSVVPVALLLIGGVGLLTTVGGRRRDRTAREEEPGVPAADADPLPYAAFRPFDEPLRDTQPLHTEADAVTETQPRPSDDPASHADTEVFPRSQERPAGDR